MKIIAMAGRARSGKDTAGEYLVREKLYHRIAFASPMKRMIASLLGKSQTWVNEHKEEVIPSIGYSPRELLQTLGTEWGRETLNKDFWVDIAFKEIDACRTMNVPGVVITDCRFENEAARIRKEGGVICHVSRDNIPLVAEHSSESGIMLNFQKDFRLLNNTTIEDLYSRVDTLLEMLGD